MGVFSVCAFFAFSKKLEIEGDICKKCEKTHSMWKKIGLISMIVLPINLIIGFNLEDPSLLFFNAITFSTIILSLMAYHKVRHGLKVTGFDEGEFTVTGLPKGMSSVITK